MDICTNGVEAINLKEVVIALNDLLTAIYGIETRLSDLLINIGFDKTQVECLRKHHLQQVVLDFLENLKQKVMTFHDGERAYKIISRYYGLDGKARETLQSLGEQLTISRERVRQLKEKTLKKCRNKSSRQFFETKLQQEATQLLSTLS
ncbi:sigma factor-like helix-turn-helix DNA-binding protein [Nostoc sp.]